VHRRDRWPPPALQAPPTSEALAGASSEVLSNPLYDDPALRLTPRLSDPAAAPAAAVCPYAPAAQVPKQRSGPALPGSTAAAHASMGAGQAWPLAPAPAASLLPTAAGSGALVVKGFPVSEALPLAAFPAAAAAAALPAGPGGLSILYENQAMRMERAELKSELKLISARVGHPGDPVFCPVLCMPPALSMRRAAPEESIIALRSWRCWRCAARAGAASCPPRPRAARSPRRGAPPRAAPPPRAARHPASSRTAPSRSAEDLHPLRERCDARLGRWRQSWHEASHAGVQAGQRPGRALRRSPSSSAAGALPDLARTPAPVSSCEQTWCVLCSTRSAVRF
jgi:hypothetical protein